MSRLDEVSFEPGFPLPAGMPTQGWQTKSARGNNDQYVVAQCGRLYLEHKGLKARFKSSDASGVFHLYTSGMNGEDWYELSLHFHNGSVYLATPELSRQDGFRGDPTWHLEADISNGSSDDVDALIAIIRSARIHGTRHFATDSVRIMVALALCDQELLAEVPPANAWRFLSQEQVIAISTWWK